MGLLVTTAALHDPVTAASTRLGTDLRITAAPTGELDVAPRGAFLRAERLPAGRHAVGRMSVRNQTSVTLSVTARAALSSTGFADGLHLRMQVGSETVADGTFQSLTTGSQPWLLTSGAAVDIVVEAWLAPTDDGYHADTVQVDLRFETERRDP